MFEVKQGFRIACDPPAERDSLASESTPCKGSEFAALPLTGSGFREPEGQPPRGRLFLGYLLFGEAKRRDRMPVRLPGRSRLGRGGVEKESATPARNLDGKRSESASRVRVIFAIKPRKKL
jgi:hypothetical protein